MKENINESRFENGLTILTDRMPGVRSATLGFFYRIGSRHEPIDLNGITHFIEHCVFKGTRRYSARDLAAIQDRLGGNLDAFTTHEETGFVIKVTDDRLVQAFDLLAEILTHPRFEQHDCLTERNVIEEEIKMNEDAPEELLGDLFYKHFFPAHPLGLPITGTPETLKRFDSSTVHEYHQVAFSPSNLVITAAGNIEHNNILDLCSRLEFGSKQTFSTASTPPKTAAPIYLESRPDLEQAHLMIAVPFVAARDERRYAADLLAGIIGGGVSSRLWQRVREERGLAYSIGAAASMYSDCGFLTISAATSPDSVEELLDIVIDEFRWIIRNGVTTEELELIKEHSRASILLSLEDSSSRAGSLAQFELVFGRQIPVEESLARIAAVTPSEIVTVAREYFRTEKIALVGIGPLDGLSIDRSRLEIGV